LKASIAIDGISLTMAGVGKKVGVFFFCVWIIPHTLRSRPARKKSWRRGEPGGRLLVKIHETFHSLRGAGEN